MQFEWLMFNCFVSFQLSFIQHSLMSPEVFCFADYPCHTVAIDILKAPPEDDNREIATWYAARSLTIIYKHLAIASWGSGFYLNITYRI